MRSQAGHTEGLGSSYWRLIGQAAIYVVTRRNPGFPRQLRVRVTIARANLVVAVPVMASRGPVRSLTVRDAAHLVPEPYLIGAVDVQGEPDRP
jgi:hypothetical protein